MSRTSKNDLIPILVQGENATKTREEILWDLKPVIEAVLMGDYNKDDDCSKNKDII